ncbi:MAG: hypothetical protein V4696_13420 [Pseudomonadota bacterium]
MYFQFGPLAPDLNPRLNDSHLRVADGVLPSPDGYKPVGQWVQVFSALPAAAKGAATFISANGEAVIVAGTETNLYRGAAAAFTSIASGYVGSSEQRWRFAQFGTVAVATNAADVMQKIDLSTFAVTALGGSPPKFEFLAVVAKGFLVGTVMNGDVLTLAWSAAFNAEQWTPGTGQSDYQTLPTGGRINGMLSGEYGIILQRERLVRMDYIGGGNVFDFSEVSSNVGCVSPNSVAQWGNLGFFLSDEGFMQWDGGLTAIGREIIDAEFRTAYNVGDWESMSTAIDPVRGVVMWSMGDKIYCYDWTLQKWSTITYASPFIFAGVTTGISIDEQDPNVGALDDDVDGVGLASFDSAAFRGGDPRLYVFNASSALGALTGTPMAATFTMNDLEPMAGHRMDMRFVRPDIEATSGLTLTLGTKQRLGDSLVNTAYTSLRDSGEMPVRTSGRYTRPTLAVAAGSTWTHAKGLDLIGQKGAGR